MSVWLKYRLGWYDLHAYPSFIKNGTINQLVRIREFGVGKWLFSLGFMIVLGTTLVLAAINGLWLPVLQVYVEAVTTPWLYLQSLGLLVAMIIAFDRVQRLHPVMRSSVINLFAPGRQSSIDNVLLWPSRAPLIGITGLVLLILTVPYFATLEEIMFRMIPNPFLDLYLPDGMASFIANSGIVGVLIWSVLVFGLVHLYSGSRLGDTLALGLVGGGWFALQNAINGIHVAAITHTNYNLVAIAFMTSPVCQQVIEDAINTSLSALGRKSLAKPPLRRIAEIEVRRTPAPRRRRLLRYDET